MKWIKDINRNKKDDSTNIPEIQVAIPLDDAFVNSDEVDEW